MSISRQVKCINKGDRYNPHTRIISIGGTGWKEAQQTAIKQILNNTHSYWVSVGGISSIVIVAYHNLFPYLKTNRDTTTIDNLLSLDECP